MTETTEVTSRKTGHATAKRSVGKGRTESKSAIGAELPAKPAPRKSAPKNPAPTTVKTRKKLQMMSAEERRRLIAEAAYLLAEQRGFCGGDPVQDWVEAEAALNARLAKTS